MTKASRSELYRSLRGSLCAAVVAALTFASAASGRAAERGPIGIGIIAAESLPVSAAITKGAELAASEINAAGGIDGRTVKLFKYDDHRSASDAVRAFQRAVKENHVVAVVGAFISEIDLALMPWAARLHMPYIATGASDKIATMVHDDYARYKYVFEGSNNSYYIARTVCDITHDTLVKRFGFKTAVIMSENAAWTKPLDLGYEECLPQIGLKVVGHIRFAPDTSDFTPIFDKIEALHADVIIAGMAHVGLKPTVQWYNEHVPALLAGVNIQAGASNFWARTNGGAQGVITHNAGAPGAAVTARSIPFANAFLKRFRVRPTLEAYLTYDSMYALKQAIERARSTRPDALVAALEKTNLDGATGHMEFYGRKARFTHVVKYGAHYVSGVGVQWQNGKQVAIWPPQAATGVPILPSFVKAPRH